MTGPDKKKLDELSDPDDLVEKDDLGDGKLTILDAEGTELGSFTANQATGTDTEITLPDILKSVTAKSPSKIQRVMKLAASLSTKTRQLTSVCPHHLHSPTY